MPTPKQYREATPVTTLLVAEPTDTDAIAEAIHAYIGNDPRRALALEVVLVRNIAERIGSEMREQVEDPSVRVELQHARFEDETGEEVDDEKSAPSNLVMHLVEHVMNDEIEELYDHLIDITSDAEAFMQLLAPTTVLYRKIMRIEDDGHSRLQAIKVDEDGMEVIVDIGNKNIGFGKRRRNEDD